MNEIISPKHSNESKIKTDASVIFGGDNKGCGCQTQIQLSTRYTSIFFGVELLFFLLSLFRLIRNKNIYVHENKNTSESQSARSDRLRKNTFCVHVHNCTEQDRERERERNHHKMTQDQIKTTSGTVVIDACTKESDGRFCLWNGVHCTHTHTLACTFAFPCPLIWFNTANKRGIKGIRRELERERKRKKIKGDDICYINISRSFDRIILHLPRLSCFISVLSNFGDLKYLIRNAPILICVFVCARIIPYLPVEKKFYVVVYTVYAHIQFHCGNILLFLSLHEWSNQNISALFASHEKNFTYSFFPHFSFIF